MPESDVGDRLSVTDIISAICYVGDATYNQLPKLVISTFGVQYDIGVSDVTNSKAKKYCP